MYLPLTVDSAMLNASLVTMMHPQTYVDEETAAVGISCMQ